MSIEAAREEQSPSPVGAPERVVAEDPGRGPVGSSPYVASPYTYAQARRLAVELDLTDPVAIALVRRGRGTIEEARAFLAAEETYAASRFAGINDAVDLATIAIEAGSRITVHGDYDVDGICATAVLVGALRELGADCDWLIPDRSADGYGLGPNTLNRLAERGTELLITVDCGIASADPVDHLRAAGIEVIVTDHHQPGERLPACPIVHPTVSGYPFADLCGTAVAAKLAALLRGSEEIERDLDLVGVATIADMVPLVGENRTLAKRGLAELRRARRPGLRELMRISKVEPELADETDVGFRLAPRLNAAGRLYRADAGVELMLCADGERAAEIATELDGANHERRETERAVFAAAGTAMAELPEAARDGAAIVVAGEGWHPGVVGIVASRLVECHGLPAIVLSLDGSGRARGSGRAPSGYDLLSGLKACEQHLDRFGGHRAAAGMELAEDSIPAFRAALAADADRCCPQDGFSEPQTVDAFVGAESLTLEVAEQLGGLGPFGLGNPSIKLLVPGVRVEDLEEMGEGGKHARFNLSSASARARGVAFNSASKLRQVRNAPDSPHDLVVRLEVNHWNGVSEPRAVLVDVQDRDDARERGAGPLNPAAGQGAGQVVGPGISHLCAGAPPERWWSRFDAELAAGPASTVVATDDPLLSWSRGERTLLDRRGHSALARIAELSSSGERLLVLTADAARRAALLGAGAAETGAGRCCCARCDDAVFAEAAAAEGPGLLVSDWGALARAPQSVASFEHLVVLDPPVTAAAVDAAAQPTPRGGFLHLLLAPVSELALGCWDAEWNLRPALAEIYKSVGGAGCAELAGEGLRDALTGAGAFPRTPEVAARCVRVLTELGIAELLDAGDARLLRVVSSGKTELDRSDAWSACQTTHQAGQKFLEKLTMEPHRSPNAPTS